MIEAAGTVALLMWALVAAAPWRPWSTRERLDAPQPDPERLDDVTALVPARDEAAHIGDTLAGLGAQGAGLSVIVIDDQSGDDTAATAAASGLPRLQVLRGTAPPAGWSGKLWALEQGRLRVQTDLILLVDADVRLDPGVVGALRAKLRERDLAAVSLMVELRMRGFWERLLLPAFVYFFKLLYPFRLANAAGGPVAAAAGGCILLRQAALADIGGFGALRGALIDDCTLARRLKARGHRTWIGLTHAAHCTRAYPELGDVWRMVARSAFTQLRHSPALLALCTLAMLAAFVAPLAALLAGDAAARAAGAGALALMTLTYVPLLRYYALAPAWAATLPIAGVLYLGMTWSSALAHWRGAGAQWKGRSYVRALGE